MAKQLLIYQSAVPVTTARHAEVCVRATADYAFSAGINAVPLMAVEFLRAAGEYAIVFTQAGEEVLPAAVLGIKGDQNLYLSQEGRWQARYIPAFIRRYPFVFSSSEDGKRLSLCIDESHPGVNREGQGERLFSSDGRPTAYVERALKFLQEYEAHFQRTRLFCRRISEMGLLEPMQAQVSTPRGEKLSLGGFLSIKRDTLRKLSGETLAKLAANDELELLYLQLYSMRNFTRLKDRLVQTQTGAAEAPVAEPVA